MPGKHPGASHENCRRLLKAKIRLHPFAAKYVKSDE
jgi:hypothetical protein